MRNSIDLPRARKMAEAGMNAPEIAKALGVTRAAIYYAAQAGKISLTVEPRIKGGKPKKKSERKPGRPGRIDLEALRVFVREGRSTKEIAEAFGVQSPAVTRTCHAHGVPLPGSSAQRKAAVGGRADGSKSAQQAPQNTAMPPPALPPREAELRATGGRYADLRAWARKWGTTETKALQEWLKLRLPVSKGASR